MRGDDAQLQAGMFSYIALEDRIPPSHPLRAVRRLVDTVLAEMSSEFDELYADGGRRSIPPERLLRALLLQVFYSNRSMGGGVMALRVWRRRWAWGWHSSTLRLQFWNAQQVEGCATEQKQPVHFR